ncbi:hypothetical protein GGH92_010183 [Coemansia sp. RSA 2673]|nr:hypothetical protein GGH92_010183 [Coemansia sp. RSA 2673]
MPIPTNPRTANMLSIGTLLQQNHPRADHQRYHPHPQHFQQQPHYPPQQQQQLSQSTQTMRQSGSTSSVQGMFGGGSDEINLQSDYASQFGYASQATVLNMHGLSGLPSAPVSSSQGRPSTLNSALPVGHPSTATAASFDQMIRERHVQNGHCPPPSLAQLSNASMAVLPPGSLDYQMRGFLRDNNSQ